MQIKSTSGPTNYIADRPESEVPAKTPESEKGPTDKFSPNLEKPSFLQSIRPNQKKLRATATFSLSSVAVAGLAALATEVAGPAVGVFGTTALVTAASVIKAHRQGTSLKKATLHGAQFGFYNSMIGESAAGLDHTLLTLGASGTIMGGITYLTLSQIERKRGD